MSDNELGRLNGPSSLRDEAASASSPKASVPAALLPSKLVAELIALPEDVPEDFECIICQEIASNCFNWSPREYHRPPICASCESVTGYSLHGRARHRGKPKGGTFRDKREAIRIGAMADAIAQEATQKIWREKHG